MIIKYQGAYREIAEALNKNRDILAAFVYGSMVNGDLWEESDIDLLVVYKGRIEESLKDIHCEVSEVPVHIKGIEKNTLVKVQHEKGGNKIKDILFSSKIIFSKDNDITNVYNNIKYIVNEDREAWSLVYLGNLLRDLGVCKKYLSNGGFLTSYEILVRSLAEMAKLYLNLNGYQVNKDSLRVLSNLEDNFNGIVENLVNNTLGRETIEETIKYIENYIDKEVIKSSTLIMKILQDADELLSSNDIRESNVLRGFNIDIESILNFLYKKSLIIKGKREVYTKSELRLVSENVYGYKAR